MIYTPLTIRAMQIAYDAHHGQLDYNGIPYIFHPVHLAESMDDEISCCAALLHDVVEAMERLGDVKQCKAALAQLVLSVYDCCLEKEGQCFLSDRCLNAMNDLERMKSVSELAEWAKDNLRSLLEASSIVPNLKNADMIYSALQYIEDHYNERFSLQDIADYVHFSAPYFSKVFKKERNKKMLELMKLMDKKKFALIFFIKIFNSASTFGVAFAFKYFVVEPLVFENLFNS